ncbi:MAG: class II glutamine amidotransferase [Gammaproteobacteria bacterium]
MCGIVGLYLKNPKLNASLGKLFEPMLIQMTQRGPDSAGFAIYREQLGADKIKVVLQHTDADFDWRKVNADIASALGTIESAQQVHNHYRIVLANTGDAVREFFDHYGRDIAIVSIGRAIEIYKEVGTPAEVAAYFGLQAMHGSHAIGHTRMATESAVTTAGSHPFSTGDDICLVHNGSLSNHNRLREKLKMLGARFFTENDTEVAANYFATKLACGDSLEKSLEDALLDLDGFYTFAIGTADGFAVLRDPIACKPAVMAETEDWVALASEYRSLADLPGIGSAELWEPEPGVPYIWESAQSNNAEKASPVLSA